MNNLAEERNKPVAVLSEPDEELIDFYDDNVGVSVDEEKFITEHSDIIDDPPTLTVIRGLIAPPGLSTDERETLEEAVMEVMTERPEWEDQMIDLGSFPAPAVGDEVEANIDEFRDEIDPFIPLLQDFAAEHS